MTDSAVPKPQRRIRRTLTATVIVALSVLGFAPRFAAATPTPSRTVATSTSTISGVSVPAVAQLAASATGEGTGPDANLRKMAALAGYISYALMGASIVWGVLTTTGWARRWVRRQTLYGGHMTLAITTLVFTLLHAVSYVFQTGDNFSWIKVVLPIGEPEVGIGVISFELMLAVSMSIWIQRRLSYRRWHIIHWLVYPAYGLGLAHVFATSTEATQGLLFIALLVTALCVVALLILRSLPATALVKARIAPLES